LVGVLEDHSSLCVDGLRAELGLLSVKVLFEQINLVVLADALLGGVRKVSSCGLKAEIDFTKHFLLVLCDVKGLSVVKFLGPSTDGMAHTTVVSDDTLGVDLKANGLATVSNGVSGERGEGYLLCART
jgi:hypothetical protein